MTSMTHSQFETEPGLALPMQQIERDLRNVTTSHIILATAGDPVVRRDAMAELADRLSGKYALREFDFDAAKNLSLPRFCRTLSGPLPGCVFAYGLENLKARDPEAYLDALAFLNNHREDIRDTRSSVVLWLTPDTRKDLFERSPDFTDWRLANEVFERSSEGGCDKSASPLLSPQDAEQVRNQARRIQEMLTRPNLDACLRAEFQEQLAAMFEQLGE